MNSHPGMILLSCGGTGGHVTPAAALATELTARGRRVEIAMDARAQRYAAMFAGLKIHVVPAGSPVGSPVQKIRGLIGLLRGLVSALVLVRRLKPAAVAGFGGYPSFPAMYAAQILGVPTLLHEQNAVFGLANKVLARKARRIALSLPETEGIAAGLRSRCVVTGNPVRPAIAELRARGYDTPQPGGVLRVFVVGGSLGAEVFSAVVPPALASLPDDVRRRIAVVQQCREQDLVVVQAAYAQAGITARVQVFFDDMAAEIAQAHLIVARAGASTVAELAVAGRPALFVPYPHHKDRQQAKNAALLAKSGGAWIVEEPDFTAAALKARVEEFIARPEILAGGAAAARGSGYPGAARALAHAVEGLINHP